MKSYAPDFSYGKEGYGSEVFGTIDTAIKTPVLDLPNFKFVEKAVRRKGKRKFKRRPSMVAVEFDIRALKPVKGEYSGLFARPII